MNGTGQLAPSLSPFWLSGIVVARAPQTHTLAEWLGGGAYQVMQAATPNSFTIQTRDSAVAVAAIAHDADRFASASFESAHAVARVPHTPKATGWLMLKAYYTGFMAAHSLMRVFGTSMTQIDGSLARRMNVIATDFGFGGSGPLADGYYRITVDTLGGALSGTAARYGTSGIHHQFWRTFFDFLTSLSDRALREIPGPPGFEASNRLDDLRSLLNNSGRSQGQWLSTIRNEVNYRLGHGCWYPYDIDAARAASLYRTFGMWRGPSKSIRLALPDELTHERFIAASAFLASLCRETAISVASLAPKRSRAFGRASLPFLRLSRNAA